MAKNVPNPKLVPNQPTRRPGIRPEYRVIPDKRLVWVKFAKRTTEKEIAGYAKALCLDPAFDPEFSEIVDLRDVEDLDLQGDEMMELADKIDPFSYQAKRAFVVSNAVQSHAVRMHQILRISKENIATFHSMEEAERWVAKVFSNRGTPRTAGGDAKRSKASAP